MADSRTSPAAQLSRSPGITLGAPHVRDTMHVRRAMHVTAVALVPCLGMAIWNTGYQANLAVERLGADAATGWRSDLFRGLGLTHDPASLPAALISGLLYVAPVLIVAWVLGEAWERLFASVRRRPRVPGVFVLALVFTLLMPPYAPLWQVALGMTFGVVLAKEVFGGTGMGFLHPAVAGAAFLHLAYGGAIGSDPLFGEVDGYAGTTIFGEVAAAGVDAVSAAGVSWWDAFVGREQGTLGTTSALACVVGAVVLVLNGVASWRAMLGVGVGVAVTAVLVGLDGGAGPVAELGAAWHLVLGGSVFAAVFLVTDPASTATTNAGRWLAGGLVGFMIVLIRTANPIHPDGTMFAVLLGSIFAPLIDHGVIWVHMRKRRRRHG